MVTPARAITAALAVWALLSAAGCRAANAAGADAAPLRAHHAHALIGAGLHQSYTTTLTLAPRSHNVTITQFRIDWLLPSHIYVDIDELNDRHRHQQSTGIGSDGVSDRWLCRSWSLTGSVIDVELPQFVSPAHAVRVHCFGRTDTGTLSFDTPIHFRYHAPSESGSQRYYRVHLASPVTALAVMIDDQWHDTTVTDSGSQDAPLIVDIPVGSLDDVGIVGLTTLLAVGVGCTWICWVMWREGQRLQGVKHHPL